MQNGTNETLLDIKEKRERIAQYIQDIEMLPSKHYDLIYKDWINTAQSTSNKCVFIGITLDENGEVDSKDIKPLDYQLAGESKQARARANDYTFVAVAKPNENFNGQNAKAILIDEASETLSYLCDRFNEHLAITTTEVKEIYKQKEEQRRKKSYQESRPEANEASSKDGIVGGTIEGSSDDDDDTNTDSHNAYGKSVTFGSSSEE